VLPSNKLQFHSSMRTSNTIKNKPLCKRQQLKQPLSQHTFVSTKTSLHTHTRTRTHTSTLQISTHIHTLELKTHTAHNPQQASTYSSTLHSTHTPQHASKIPRHSTQPFVAQPFDALQELGSHGLIFNINIHPPTLAVVRHPLPVGTDKNSPSLAFL
jgi:hypothetical protein